MYEEVKQCHSAGVLKVVATDYCVQACAGRRRKEKMLVSLAVVLRRCRLHQPGGDGFEGE